MYIDYYPIETVTSAILDEDIIAVHRARRLTPIRDLLPRHEIPVQKSHPHCHLHKGTVDGNHAYCKHCGVTYCIPCAKQLLDLDEPCWFCGTPLDLEWVSAIKKETE